MSNIKCVGIFLRDDTSKATELAKELTTWLKEKSISAVTFSPIPKSAEDIDLGVVLGGDGTYLQAIGSLKNKKTPVVGVNLGSLGFLTENRGTDLINVVQMAIEGKLIEEWRCFLRVEVNNKKVSRLALNDVVIERGNEPQLINVGVFCDDKLVTETKADGMIISSPTGSTAYNLAAGGPICHPAVQAMVVTPISPHSLTTRPILFPDDRHIKLKILGKDRKGFITIDGDQVCEISDKDEILIRVSDEKHLCLRHPKYGFFHLLREKLKFGERD